MKRTLLLTALLLGLVWVLLEPVDRENGARSTFPASDDEHSTAFQPWRLRSESELEVRRGEVGNLPGARRVDIDWPTGSLPKTLNLPLGDSHSVSFEIQSIRDHGNGDRSLITGDDQGRRALLTIGPQGLFARIHSARGVFELRSDRTGSWLVDLSQEELEVDRFGADAISAADSGAPGPRSPHWQPPDSFESHQGQADDRIDVMFLHTPAMAHRYPDGLLETRVNHLVAIANQALVDSQVNAQVRLVRLEQTSYSRRQDTASALSDLRGALAGEIIPGLEGLLGRRSHYGADLIVLTWPHDIETRGACGMAYYPQIDNNGRPSRELGVQVTNDGQSNWSVCSDAVFAHELGHNLGAQHQRETIQSPDPQGDNFAWTRSNRWHTIMGSFGTGHVDRYRRLDIFSNPSIRCGGQPCGSTTPGDRANNARLMSELAPVVAGYFGQQGTTTDHPDPSEGDQDGDGTADRDDPYPFDPDNGNGPSEPVPDADFSQRRLEDSQAPGDWELLVVSSGNDRVLSWGLDGKFRGTVAAPEPVNPGPILTEYSDLLVDGEGRLYLLASEDVRRFDRLSGRLIDVFLDSALPQPRSLQSSFPRALGWLDDDRLVVLGDNAIELYNNEGRHLNPLNGGDATQDPGSWSDAIDLPLRAIARRGGRVFVAEAANDRIMTFSASEGERGSDVADSPGALTDPWDMALGPDGMLYVANGAASNILRFDPVERHFVDEFVPAGRGGLDFARALAFGPEGDLYVASRNNHAVLRFDGEDGAFIDVVADAESGPLLSPESLVIAPVVDELGPGHSGHYFVPMRSGEGWLLEILDDEHAAISWFTYPAAGSAAGEQAWVVGVGDIEGRRIVFDEMLATRQVDAEAPIGSDNITLLPWGRLELTFGHCGFGRAHYDSPLFEAEGTLDFVRLIAIDGLPCGSAPKEPNAAAPGISGQWNDPDSSGQGWFLQELGDGQVFTAWFTYDEQGEQAWIVGEGELTGRRLVFEDMVQTGGASFGSDFDPDEVQSRQWGRLEFDFESCNAAAVEFEPTLPEFEAGQLQAERLTRLDSLDCRLQDE